MPKTRNYPKMKLLHSFAFTVEQQTNRASTDEQILFIKINVLPIVRP